MKMDSFGSSDLQATFDDFGNGADDALHLQDLIAGGPNEFNSQAFFQPNDNMTGVPGGLEQVEATIRPPVVVSVATNAPIIVHDTIVNTLATSTTKKKPTASRVTNQRKKKDPNAPVGPSKAYTLFFRDKQAAIKAQNPAAKFGDISKIVASLWEALGDEEKSVYRKRNEADKIRYREEMKAYESGLLLAKDNNKTASLHEEINEDAKQVFSSTEETTQVSTHLSFQQQPEETTTNQCIKQGCMKLAIISSEWDGEYCCNECAVGHCKDVFAAWVAGGK